MDIKAFDLNLLASLEALLAERNVTRAAERLGLSQPALSAQLAKLRLLFNDPLLLPAPRGMTPTARALALAAPLARALTELRGVVEAGAVFDPVAARFDARIAASDYAQTTLLVPLMERLRATAPGIRLAWVNLDTGAIERQLEQGAIDFALTTPRDAPSSAHSRVVAHDRFVCAMRPGHPLATSPLTLEALCAAEHVQMSPRSGAFAGPADDWLAELGLTRRVALSVPGLLVIPEVLTRSDLIAVVQERVANSFADRLAVRELPLASPGFTLIAVWHARDQHNAAHRWLRRQLRMPGTEQTDGEDEAG